MQQEAEKPLERTRQRFEEKDNLRVGVPTPLSEASLATSCYETVALQRILLT